MKIFLTGEIQVGKSTVIARTLSLLNIAFAGFRTYFSADRTRPDRLLYMNSPSAPFRYSEENVVARFSSGVPHVLTERFDTLGVDLIRAARMNARLIVMDECGTMEKEALVFQRELLETLDGTLPVLGVIKLSSQGSWTDKISRHPQVHLLTVTEQNRDALPRIIAGQLASSL